MKRYLSPLLLIILSFFLVCCTSTDPLSLRAAESFSSTFSGQARAGSILSGDRAKLAAQLDVEEGRGAQNFATTKLWSNAEGLVGEVAEALEEGEKSTTFRKLSALNIREVFAQIIRAERGKSETTE